MTVLFTDGTSPDWTFRHLARAADGSWVGGFPVTGTAVQFIAQAVDAAGNVGLTTNKGDVLRLRQPPRGAAPRRGRHLGRRRQRLVPGRHDRHADRPGRARPSRSPTTAGRAHHVGQQSADPRSRVGRAHVALHRLTRRHHRATSPCRSTPPCRPSPAHLRPRRTPPVGIAARSPCTSTAPTPSPGSPRANPTAPFRPTAPANRSRAEPPTRRRTVPHDHRWRHQHRHHSAHYRWCVHNTAPTPTAGTTARSPCTSPAPTTVRASRRARPIRPITTEGTNQSRQRHGDRRGRQHHLVHRVGHQHRHHGAGRHRGARPCRRTERAGTAARSRSSFQCTDRRRLRRRDLPRHPDLERQRRQPVRDAARSSTGRATWAR